MTKHFGRLIGVVVACAVTAGSAGAYTFTSLEGNCQAEFPVAPTLEKTSNKTTSGIPYDQYVWSIENNTGWWGIGMIVYSKPVTKDYDANIRGAVAATKGTLRSQRPIQQSGVTGREILIDVQGPGVVRQRLLWIGERLYQAVFTGAPGTEATADVEAFLNSFRTIK
jgi:hypothetical protein